MDYYYDFDYAVVMWIAVLYVNLETKERHCLLLMHHFSVNVDL